LAEIFFMDCEVCGRGARSKARIENVAVAVCERCVALGQEIKVPARAPKPKPLPPELEQVLRQDFASVIKRSRERAGLTQEQLAQRLNEKTSLIRRIENGWEPSLALIRKLERFFRIKLTLAVSSSNGRKIASRKPLTVGDIAEVRA
jgi:putative transcription factor